LNLYLPIAKRGRDIYFVIADLALIDPMYQYSLEYFVRLFIRRLEVTPSPEDVNERLDILKKDITEAFYDNICRGLFERHKLIYAFMISTKIARNQNNISNREWAFFSRGPTEEATEEEMEKKPLWIPTEKIW